MSILYNLQQAVIDVVNNTIPAWGVSTKWIAEAQRDKLTGRQIYVSAETRNTALIARGVKLTDVTFLIMFFRPLSKMGQAQNGTPMIVDGGVVEREEADENHDDIDTLIDVLLGSKIGGFTCHKVEQPVPTDPDSWREQRLFNSFLRVHLKG